MRPRRPADGPADPGRAGGARRTRRAPSAPSAARGRRRAAAGGGRAPEGAAAAGVARRRRPGVAVGSRRQATATAAGGGRARRAAEPATAQPPTAPSAEKRGGSRGRRTKQARGRRERRRARPRRPRRRSRRGRSPRRSAEPEAAAGGSPDGDGEETPAKRRRRGSRGGRRRHKSAGRSSTKRRPARPRRPPASRLRRRGGGRGAPPPAASPPRPRRRRARAPRPKRPRRPPSGAAATRGGAPRARQALAGRRRGRGRRRSRRTPAASSVRRRGRCCREAPWRRGGAPVEAPAAEPKTRRQRDRDRRRPKAIVRQDEGSGLGTARSERRSAGPSVVAERPERKIILVTDDGEELRVALVEDGRLSEIYIERPTEVVPGRHLPGQGRERHERHRRGVRGLRPREERLPVRRRGDDAGGREARAGASATRSRRASRCWCRSSRTRWGSKGARLSTKISLAGRYLVYVPGGQRGRRLPASAAGRARPPARHLPRSSSRRTRASSCAPSPRVMAWRTCKRDMRYLVAAVVAPQEEGRDGQAAGARAQGGRHLARGGARPLQRDLREPHRGRPPSATRRSSRLPRQGGAGAAAQGAPAHGRGAAVRGLRHRGADRRRSSAACRCRAAATWSSTTPRRSP